MLFWHPNLTVMKKKLFFISVFLIATALAGMGFSKKESFDFSHYRTGEMELNYDVPTESEAFELGYSSPRFYLFLGKSYLGFKEALGFKESRGDYHIVNTYGYLGKYQFSRATLKMIGFSDTENFLYDTRQQEAAFYAYASFNKWILRHEIERYSGKVIGGVKVSESGILAAAHLAGPGNVRKFLRSNGTVGFADANGATVRYYMKKFSGYDTSHIEANKTPEIF